MFASYVGNLEMVKILVEEKHADLTAVNARTNESPLHYSCKQPSSGVTEYLLSKGMDYNAISDGNITPVIAASKRGNITPIKEIVSYVRENNGNVEEVLNAQDESVHFILTGPLLFTSQYLKVKQKL